ncbi:16S rRNA (uracil(1498)-N(3))-methyltransferase [Saccharicrinis fermentans]|uniref:Ribosomal RNA small subunit methyltransferase E n=1 Tax=Saccharicrinis fermentans DSM 9555 = JCM 21142 TaxID=869213 RepID=W7Y5T5_9BACT|nr:16S rRNA (uracil(1498)-N(3))-methyltransferase [Saccharicrinis fermentans]GAF03507.1 ribosomal RNA small subunit methyltransferase E [Saccharicrinis fermentans DSM 9555 = JCM 21142]
MYLFYEPDFSSNGNCLSQDESKHCIRVLRHQVGDLISVMDGKGSLYSAKIIDANPKKCLLSIEKTKHEERRPYAIHMAVAPTKNIDRFEWFLEKATEMGIEEITPLLCDRSERKVIKPERLEKVIIAASKQSRKAYTPKLNTLTGFSEFIKKIPASNSYIAHCEELPKELLKIAYKAHTDAIILIGPEGDFSTREINMAMEHQIRTISLGKERLRTETAATIGCATINIINQ